MDCVEQNQKLKYMIESLRVFSACLIGIKKERMFASDTIQFFYLQAVRLQGNVLVSHQYKRFDIIKKEKKYSFFGGGNYQMQMTSAETSQLLSCKYYELNYTEKGSNMSDI